MEDKTELGGAVEDEDRPELGGVRDVAAELGGCHPATVWRRVSDGTIDPPIHIGGRRCGIYAASAKRSENCSRPSSATRPPDMRSPRPSRRAVRLSLSWQRPTDPDPPERRSRASGTTGAALSKMPDEQNDDTPDQDHAQGESGEAIVPDSAKIAALKAGREPAT